MDKTHMNIPKTAANYAPLTPVSFMRRTALTYPERPAVIYGKARRSWRETYARCRKLASALGNTGLQKSDVVGFMATNTPELYEAHFGVPMAGMVLNALNYRLDAHTIAYIIDHAEIKLLVTDREFSEVVKQAVSLAKSTPVLIDIDDPAAQSGELLGAQDYEAFIAGGDPDFAYDPPVDEWDTISINYTSGTTGKPKGVVYHHRGAYLNALGNALEWDMSAHPVYLWTLPMFHCNGWCFPWTIAAKAGVNICLRKVTAASIYDAIAEHGVNHLCGAPIVLGMMIDASAEKRAFEHTCKVMTAAAPPPAKIPAIDGAGGV